MSEATERSLSELFGDLTRDTGTLIRKELELAQLELGQKAALIGRHVAVVAVGGAVAYGGLLAIVAAAILAAVELGVAPWVAALIAGVLVMAIGGWMVQRSIAALRRTSVEPRETIRSLKETAEWAKRQAQ